MRVLLTLAAAILLSAPAASGKAPSSCLSCHRALARMYSEPVRLFEKDLHADVGLGCHDCHGGDPADMESAMLHSRGFRGAPGRTASVALCGGCHSASGRISDPTIATDQENQYLSGPHGSMTGKDRPTCVTCHGAHGMARVTDPSSPVFRTRIAGLCVSCHGPEEDRDDGAGPWRYLDDVHGRSLVHGTNPRAPTCIDCHGAHRAAVPEGTALIMVCGNCHTKEYEYFVAGPHGVSLRSSGEPSCTRCHGYHGIEASGISEIIGRITDNCQECHSIGSGAWKIGREIDEKLGVAMSFLGSLEDMSEEFRLAGLETGEMDRSNQEAYDWLVKVESAIHSVDTDWEELTGMAKVKMMAAWDLARDYSLEKGLRRVILLIVAFLASSILGLLAFKLKSIEKDQHRKQLLGSPEARQREQEHHR